MLAVMLTLGGLGWPGLGVTIGLTIYAIGYALKLAVNDHYGV